MLKQHAYVNKRQCTRYLLLAALGLTSLLFASITSAQTEPAAPPAVAEQVAKDAVPLAPEAPVPTTPQNPESYDLWVLAPAIVAILLAVLLRSAVPALFIGIVVGGYMLVPCRDAGDTIGSIAVLEGLRLAVDHYVLGAIADSGRIQIMVFTLLIGGAVGVMTASGGTRGLVNAVLRFASTSRKGQFTGWLAGMIVFFDDYANSMIVGPTMRPVFDRLKISRAKLAYIVDSTAAPIASIALIGTWLGAELSLIKDGLDSVAAQGTPEFLVGVDDMDVFLTSIPYRFYPILALWMVLMIAFTGRDFGPMKSAESRALIEPPDETAAEAEGGVQKTSSAWLAALPILALIGITFTILYKTGVAAMPADAEWDWHKLLSGAATNTSILYGGLGSLGVATFLAFVARACSMRDAFDGCLDGMARMFPAVVILVLAWALSDVSQNLHLGQVLKGHLVGAQVTPDWLPEWAHMPMTVWLPLSVFICAAGVSFATGTSWATMGILTPAVVEIAAEMAAGLPGDEASQLFYAAVGSVLAGSVFGDHCSPISDTTVLSAVASRCRVEEHVWTQLPYAIVTALVAMTAGNYYCMHEGLPPWQGLVIGAAVLFFILVLVGRRPKAPPVVVNIPPERLEQRIAGG